jgi:hypothetical protein
MKKLLVSLLLLGTFIIQSEAKVQVGIGITAGPCFGRWNNQFLHSKLSSAGGTLGHQVGAHAGIQARVWFNKFIGVNLAGEFNMGGNRYQRVSGPGGSVIIKNIHKENQITIPLTAMVGWGNERLRIFANIGGYFGYVVSAKDKMTTNINGIETFAQTGSSDFSSDSAYNKIDGGVRVGAGIQVYVDKKLKSCVTFDINYDFGLTNVFKHDHTAAYFANSNDVKLSNSKIMIGVGYIYTFGKSQSEEKPKRVTDMAE